MFRKIIALLVLLLPACAFAESSDMAGQIGSGLYVKLQYDRYFQGSVDKISSGMEEYPYAFSAVPSTESASPATKRGEVRSYDAKYKPSYLSGGAAVGYSFGSLRVELEALHSRLNIDGRDYSVSNLAKWLSLATSHGNATTTSKSLQFENDGFTNWAAMINLQLDDVSLKRMIVMPYIGGGIGVTKTRFLGSDHYNLAYQARLGFIHALNSYLKVFAGYHHFALLDGEFHNIKPLNAGTPVFNNSHSSHYNEGGEIPDRVSVRNRFKLHGFEIGFVISFYADSY